MHKWFRIALISVCLTVILCINAFALTEQDVKELFSRPYTYFRGMGLQTDYFYGSLGSPLTSLNGLKEAKIPYGDGSEPFLYNLWGNYSRIYPSNVDSNSGTFFRFDIPYFKTDSVHEEISFFAGISFVADSITFVDESITSTWFNFNELRIYHSDGTYRSFSSSDVQVSGFYQVDLNVASSSLDGQYINCRKFTFAVDEPFVRIMLYYNLSEHNISYVKSYLKHNEFHANGFIGMPYSDIGEETLFISEKLDAIYLVNQALNNSVTSALFPQGYEDGILEYISGLNYNTYINTQNTVSRLTDIRGLIEQLSSDLAVSPEMLEAVIVMQAQIEEVNQKADEVLEGLDAISYPDLEDIASIIDNSQQDIKSGSYEDVLDSVTLGSDGFPTQSSQQKTVFAPDLALQGFSSIFTNPYILSLILIIMAIVLLSYILFGKK